VTGNAIPGWVGGRHCSCEQPWCNDCYPGVTDNLLRHNAQMARQLGLGEHPDDCICYGKGYHDGIAGPVACGHQGKLKFDAAVTPPPGTAP
jgi:hypothetical protein